jgi:hypothetical protein
LALNLQNNIGNNEDDMKHNVLTATIVCSMVLSGCDALERNSKHAAHSLGNGYDKTRYKISDYIYSRENPAPDAQPPEQSPAQAYCYRLLTDTVCYDQPVAELSSTLVASQSGSYHSDDNLRVLTDKEQQSETSTSAPTTAVVNVPEAPAVNAASPAAEATSAPRALMSGF